MVMCMVPLGSFCGAPIKARRTSHIGQPLKPLIAHCRFTEDWRKSVIEGPRVPSGAIPPALKEKVKMESSARLVNSVWNFEDLPDADGRVETHEQPNQRRVTHRLVKVTPLDSSPS